MIVTFFAGDVLCVREGTCHGVRKVGPVFNGNLKVSAKADTAYLALMPLFLRC